MTTDNAEWVAVCALERLMQKRIVCARVAGTDLIVLADGDAIHACERACPHEQADLGEGRVEDGYLHCPRHAAWFSLVDGRISPGWPSRDLRRFVTRIGDGHVWVRVDARDGRVVER